MTRSPPIPPAYFQISEYRRPLHRWFYWAYTYSMYVYLYICQTRSLAVSWHNDCMQATVDLPEVVLKQIEALAEREGATPGDLIRRVVEAYVARSEQSVQRKFDAPLPLIPASATGPIQLISGNDLDQLASRDDLPS